MITKSNLVQSKNAELQFEEKIYFEIDKIYPGEVYSYNNRNLFYRILEIPSEENITLYAEKISIDEEGGNYQLIKRIRITDDGSALSKFGLHSVDSLKFIDSVNVQGYFNKEKKTINIDAIKSKPINKY